MYSDVVLGVDHAVFEDILDGFKDDNDYSLDTELSADDWVHMVVRVQEGRRARAGPRLPAPIRANSCGAPSAPCSARG